MIYNITIIGNKLHFQTQLDSSPAFLCIPASFLCIPVHSCAFLSHSCVFLSHSCRFRSHSCKFLWIPVDSCGFLWIPVDSCGFLWIPVDSCGFLWIPVESGNSGRNLWGSEKYWLWAWVDLRWPSLAAVGLCGLRSN